jgi:iron(III) transport system permease protein
MDARLAIGPAAHGLAFAVLFAYAVRFLTIGVSPRRKSGKNPSSFDEAARSLGVSVGGTLWRIHLPLMRGSVLTAFVLVWVEVMKELPATLLLRPLGLKTLAIEVWERTSESMWADAAIPALAIVAVGFFPLFLTSRLMSDAWRR